MVEDIRGTADVLRPVYETSAWRDGYVSLEVSPGFAHDTAGTVERARALWRRIARDNLMIKVPATPEGIAALPALLADGINVNVTLLFARGTYRRVTEAHLAGLEAFAAKGGALDRLASVASIFVSRLDVLIDPRIEERAQTARGAEKEEVEQLVGRVAIANAKLIFQDYLDMVRGPRFQALAARGAQPQRVLWASTGTKDPRRSDVLYVEALMGPDTVDTVPPATLHALLNHGRARASLEEDMDGARLLLESLADAGISLDECTDELLSDGVAKFQKAFDNLMGVIERRRAGTLGSALDRTQRRLPRDLEAAVSSTLEEWRASGKVRRLWAGDATLWTGHDESRWLGWLSVAEQQIGSVARLRALAYEVKRRAFAHVALLGMGGSSLCPDVLARTFPPGPGFPALAVLDSTDPARSRRSRRDSTSIAPCSSCLASPARRSSPTSSTHISTTSCDGAWGRPRRARGSPWSPIPARLSRASPGTGAMHTCSTACRRSAGATRRSRISAWCRPRRWASTWSASSRGPR